MFGESTLVFLRYVGSRIASAKGDVRERTWLLQRISLAVVRGNAISMSCRRSFCPKRDDYLCDSVCNDYYCIKLLVFVTKRMHHYEQI